MLRYGVTHAAFVDISKRVYVRLAARDFQIAGRKQSAAPISVLTGLPRKDLADYDEDDDTEPGDTEE